jgi:hypothetical protein
MMIVYTVASLLVAAYAAYIGATANKPHTPEEGVVYTRLSAGVGILEVKNGNKTELLWWQKPLPPQRFVIQNGRTESAEIEALW